MVKDGRGEKTGHDEEGRVFPSGRKETNNGTCRDVKITKMIKGACIEGHKSLVAYDLSKLNQDEENNLNSFIARNETEAVTNEYSNQESRPRQIYC